jgi:hypothetical protein
LRWILDGLEKLTADELTLKEMGTVWSEQNSHRLGLFALLNLL